MKNLHGENDVRLNTVVIIINILFSPLPENWDYRLALNVTRRGQAVPIRSALRTSYIILILIGLFVISWTPYAVITFVSQFGNNHIEPWVSALPALFAKVITNICSFVRQSKAAYEP